LQHALERLREARIGAIETYTPTPTPTPTPAPTPAPTPTAPPVDVATGSPLPLAMFAAGMAGFAGCFLLMTYADVYAYPLDIGGRPLFAWPAFVPIAFEVGVLCAMVVGFFGYFIVCRMPQLYDPVDECDSLKRALRDGWFVAIRTGDPERAAQARAIIEALHPASVEEFAA